MKAKSFCRISFVSTLSMLNATLTMKTAVEAIDFLLLSPLIIAKTWNRSRLRQKPIKLLIRTTNNSQTITRNSSALYSISLRDWNVPSINDRDLKIISSLSPETALRGNTELLYVDAARKHELPELYNGLGFKNLIYMAIQARHYHSQWIRTSENRPLCQLLSIEEPEVHLHAQVQQTFINNIWSVLEQSAKDAGEKEMVPQLIVTTHSSHILDTIDFSKVRYFRRQPLEGEVGQIGILNASEVRSLRSFRPAQDTVEGNIITPEELLKFLN